VKASDRVKKWRNSCKERMIQAMGGKCCICNYSKCNSALAFHHLDPTKKDLSISSAIVNPKSWSKIIEELRKCILVCHNCHSEIHYGITKIPDNYPKFNESFADYKEELSECIVCKKLKSIKNKTCSYQCAGKLKNNS